MGTLKHIAISLVTAGLVGTGLLTAPLAQAAPDRPPAPIAWTICADPQLVRAGAQCGTVTVPLDHDQPSGDTIELAVSRIAHTTPDNQYQGVMLVNPGGPGGSGLRLSLLRDRVPNDAGAAYDWIGFDPRGVGSSTPALSCIRDYAGYRRPHYVPETREIEQAWLTLSHDYADACERKGGALLQHLTTLDSAKDIDSIRRALGRDQINYYGFSYGTYLGAVYATVFPTHVRRMVLDGNVDPRRVWEQANYGQDVAFDRNIAIYFDWVAKYDDVYHLGSSGAEVENLYYDQYEKLRIAPAAGLIGSSEWNDIFLQAGYYVFGWTDVADAFARWVNEGDPTGLLALYPPPIDDNGFAIYLGVQCTDTQWSSYHRFRRDNAELYPKAPFLTWGNAWFNTPCTFWPAPSRTPVDVDGSKAPAPLLISETLDAATPFEGSLEMRRRFPGAALVEGLGGTTHSASLFGGACVDGTVAAYLATGALPERVAGDRSDKRCDPIPQPVPGARAETAPPAAHGEGSQMSRAMPMPQRWPDAAAARPGRPPSTDPAPRPPVPAG